MLQLEHSIRISHLKSAKSTTKLTKSKAETHEKHLDGRPEAKSGPKPTSFVREETKRGSESHQLEERPLENLATGGALDRSEAGAESSRRTGHGIAAS
jgi:hypothetical protein